MLQSFQSMPSSTSSPPDLSPSLAEVIAQMEQKLHHIRATGEQRISQKLQNLEEQKTQELRTKIQSF